MQEWVSAKKDQKHLLIVGKKLEKNYRIQELSTLIHFKLQKKKLTLVFMASKLTTETNQWVHKENMPTKKSTSVGWEKVLRKKLKIKGLTFTEASQKNSNFTTNLYCLIWNSMNCNLNRDAGTKLIVEVLNTNLN